MKTESATVVSVPRGQYVQIRVELEDGERATVSMEKEYQYKPGDAVKVSVLRRDDETVVVFGGGLRRLFGPAVTLLVGAVLIVLNVDLPFSETVFVVLVVGFGGLIVLWFVFVILLHSVVWVPLFRVFFGHTVPVEIEAHRSKWGKRVAVGRFRTINGIDVEVDFKRLLSIGTEVEVRYLDLGPFWSEILLLDPQEDWRVKRKSLPRRGGDVPT